MSHEENARTMARVREGFESGDPLAIIDVYAEDVVVEWPQSGERIKGTANNRALIEKYPGLPSSKARRVQGSGDLWVSEQTLDYGGKTVHGVSIFEFRDGKVVRQTDYFADPFEAPGWRAEWVEKMEPAATG